MEKIIFLAELCHFLYVLSVALYRPTQKDAFLQNFQATSSLLPTQIDQIHTFNVYLPTVTDFLVAC
jgi:hypothetical protein